MAFLINVILALLAFFLVRYVALQLKTEEPVAVLAGVLAGIVVFIANPAAHM